MEALSRSNFVTKLFWSGTRTPLPTLECATWVQISEKVKFRIEINAKLNTNIVLLNYKNSIGSVSTVWGAATLFVFYKTYILLHRSDLQNCC